PPIKFEIGKKYLLPIAHWRDSDSKKGIDHRYSLRLNLFDDNTLVEIRDHKVFYPLVPSSNNGQNWKDYKQNISRKFFNNDY
ncbi:MAG: hypothetical protein K9G34_10155, partial [Melioribacteraceae bacterium]|nr:hypothetical protein [Melioribacteraceae bacterium]